MTAPATQRARLTTAARAGLALIAGGILAVIVCFAVALTTHTNDYACNRVVQSCPAASSADQAAAKRTTMYALAGLGAATAVAGTVLYTRRK